jgi:hypothetical protein
MLSSLCVRVANVSKEKFSSLRLCHFFGSLVLGIDDKSVWVLQYPEARLLRTSMMFLVSDLFLGHF